LAWWESLPVQPLCAIQSKKKRFILAKPQLSCKVLKFNNSFVADMGIPAQRVDGIDHRPSIAELSRAIESLFERAALGPDAVDTAPSNSGEGHGIFVDMLLSGGGKFHQISSQTAR
jgi:hypothetical protein